MGFEGRLKKDKLCGKSAPYYATSQLEVIFHCATRFASSDEKGRHTKVCLLRVVILILIKESFENRVKLKMVVVLHKIFYKSRFGISFRCF